MQPIEPNPFAPPAIAADTQRVDEPKLEPREGPWGVGGWLLLPVFGLFVTASSGIWKLYSYQQLWVSGGLDGVEHDPLWLAMIIFDLLVVLLLLGAVTVACVWFPRHDRRLPRLMIAYYIALMILALVHAAYDHHLGIEIPATAMGQNGYLTGAILMPILRSLGWIAYFRYSVRVANTFVK
jgi:hypothetical protein